MKSSKNSLPELKKPSAYKAASLSGAGVKAAQTAKRGASGKTQQLPGAGPAGQAGRDFVGETKREQKKNVARESGVKASSQVKKPAPSNPQTMEELLAMQNVTLRGFKRGDVVTGRITSISGREVLIDIGGKMEAVVGSKEWDIVRSFVAQLKVGDEIPVTIISPETEKGQLVVSIRQAGAKFRWDRIKELLESGEAVNVRVVEVNKGGLLVEFEGLRGFIPGSQLSGEHQEEMSKLVGKVLTAKVIEADQEQNRLIFSQKAAAGMADLTKKLEEVKAKVKIGEKYAGKVSAIMPYGIFVNLDNGTDGLVHISEISWAKVDNLAEMFKVGDEVNVMVLGVSETDAKLNLSIKQLLPDPWMDLAKKYSTEQEVKGKVTRVSNYGVFVQLEEGVEGLIHVSKVPAGTEYKVGEKVTCTVESIDAVAHRISLIPVLTVKPIGYR